MASVTMMIIGSITLSYMLTSFLPTSGREAMTVWDFTLKYVIPFSGLIISLFNLFRNAHRNRFSLQVEVSNCKFFPLDSHLGAVLVSSFALTNSSEKPVTIKEIVLPSLGRWAIRDRLPREVQDHVFPLKYADGSLESIGNYLPLPLTVPPSSFVFGEVLFLYLPKDMDDNMELNLEVRCVGKTVKRTMLARNGSKLTAEDYLGFAMQNDTTTNEQHDAVSDDIKFFPWDD